VRLFDVVDETSISAKISKSIGGGAALNNNNGGINRMTGMPYSQRYTTKILTIGRVSTVTVTVDTRPI
jgi:hypothetical protein